MKNANQRTVIDYYCFPTKTGDLSVFTDLEQYDYWREKVYYQITQEDVMLAMEKGKLLLFDLRNNSFINEKGDVVDISNKVIFPRSPISQADILMEYIEKTTAKCITARKDYKTIEYWFELIKVKRDYKLTTMGELEENLKEYVKKFGKRFFVKTVHKGFSGICNILEIGEDAPFLFDSHFHSLNMTIENPETPIFVSKALSIEADAYGRREWRAFVVENELWSLSRFSDYFVPIEKCIEMQVRNKIKEYEGIMPSSYVVDFFEYKGKDGETIFDVCEFNPIIASGVFQNNDLVF